MALLLAAGKGRRFGSDKRQAQLSDGQTLLAASVSNAQAQFAEVWVVIGADDDPQALGLPASVQLARAPRGSDGMGASLAAGIQALAGSAAEAVAVLLGDMPWIASATLARLQQAAGAEVIVMPQYQGQRGHPVLFGRHFWQALGQATGDQGGRHVLHDNPAACQRVKVDDPGVLRDVDTPDDLSPP
ncbi:molybdopterin-guanine dinucleotide biosynthesis protein MobA [Pseudomonas cremoricolorata]|uniref:Molybdopterin-guanine dinucleotide biosynthesis protein MobA n=1 Tax=Pseudomonas cremoricolorata TaxID=157783 RepID=A0A089WU99_9PSED|nr:molybdopterin-guanine dinucleotide biosynthesis protein MobA [Pseudomonas cremoricolorata]